MPEYDSARFVPPAPVAAITITHPATGRRQLDVPMLIDTGADVTILPLRPVRELGVDFLADTYALEGFDGTPSAAPAVRASVRFLGRTFTGQFLVLEQPVGILGRNVLNHVQLLLDGPNLRWAEDNIGTE